MQFSQLNLNPALLKAVEKMGFEETTPIQAQAVPPALAGSDIIGCAQTGTGKTAAFLLPTLHQILGDPRKMKNPRAVILAPTRELVIQVTGEARKLAGGTSLRIASIYGGAKMRPQIDKLRRGTDIIIATPGRLQDHMRRRNVNFKDLKILILDEADRMLDMGFLPDIKQIVSRMPRQRQTMLFSATMSPQVLNLTRQFQQNPEIIEIDIATPPETIRQTLYPVPKHLKTELLLALLEQMDVHSMLVFTATKQEADIVTRKLIEAKISVACIHGDFQQRQRISALEGFRAGKHQVLVATNIAARGLDVEGISHVINYDVPDNPENYVHRIGRTARAEAEGDAITLVTPDDEAMIYRIEYVLGYKIERKTLPDFDYDVPVPSWARPSPESLLRKREQSRSLADRWRSMSGGRRR
ncbi:MAG: DEAD/DEAH box helicase [Anaerolineae bacterium]|nr:DEAD/DEAH box helicase [Anaerolineae bacterium]